jgi:hypothetical protein
MEPVGVILLPGSVLPAQPAYGALLEALGPDVQAIAKDLELYADSAPARLEPCARRPVEAV